MKTKKININNLIINTHNGFFDGFRLKREPTLRECKYILQNLLGINLNTKEDFYDREEFQEYNKDLASTVKQWLEGATDDVLDYYLGDCSGEPLGVFNALNIVTYLQKHGIV